jgi:hypothetical protein
MTAQDIRRMLELLASIDARMAHIEAMLAGMANAIDTVTVENLTIEPIRERTKHESPR